MRHDDADRVRRAALLDLLECVDASIAADDTADERQRAAVLNSSPASCNLSRISSMFVVASISCASKTICLRRVPSASALSDMNNA